MLQMFSKKKQTLSFQNGYDNLSGNEKGLALTKKKQHILFYN